MTTSPRRRRLSALLLLLLLAPATALTMQHPAVAADAPPPPGVARDGNQLHVQGKPSRTGHTVKLRGPLHVVPDETGGGADRFTVTVGDATIPVALPGVDATQIRPGDTFSGSVASPAGATPDDLARRAPAAVVSATITAQAVTAPPARRLFLAVMTNRGSVPADSEILADAQSVVGYWLEQSDGAIASFTRSATVKHYATDYPSPANGCGLTSGNADHSAIRAEARSQFTGLGASDTVVVVVPESCPTNGTVGLSTGGVTFNAAGASLLATMTHEEGHELGLFHANVGSCTTTCSGQEYGDRMSVMGSGLSGAVNQLTALNSAFRSWLGWVKPGEQSVLSLPGSQTSITQDYTLLPRAAGSGLRSIQVPDPDAAGTYFIEYRRLQGRDAGSALDGPAWCCATYHPGISMLYQPTGQNLSWMHPTGPSGNYALGVDDGTYTSPSGGLVLDVLQDNGAAGVVVRVTVTSAKPAFTTAPKPVLGGLAIPDYQVTVSPGTWSPTYDSLSYQWSFNGVPIAGSQGEQSTYRPDENDLGKQLTVTVGASKGGYRRTLTTSDPVTVAWMAPRTPVIPDAATPRVGDMLTVEPGNWGFETTLAYQWYAGSTPVGNDTVLLLTDEMVGKPIRVTVTGTAHGQSISRTSADTPVVTAPPLVSAAPTITGTPVVSRALIAATGVWTSGTSFAYRWLADGVAVTGATAEKFVPSAAETGKTIQVEVAGTKTGHARTVRTSAATSAVTYAPWVPVQPVLSGTARYPNTLSTAVPFWGSEGSYAYQWLNNGVPISGATASRFTPTAAMVGRLVSVRVTGTAPDTTQSQLTSKAARIARGVLRAPTPSISGTKKVGRTLTAVPHPWTSGTSLRYQWYAGSAAISRATLRTYKLPSSAKGKQIRVRVTGRKTGYTTVAKYSARTAKVS